MIVVRCRMLLVMCVCVVRCSLSVVKCSLCVDCGMFVVCLMFDVVAFFCSLIVERCALFVVAYCL